MMRVMRRAHAVVLSAQKCDPDARGAPGVKSVWFGRCLERGLRNGAPHHQILGSNNYARSCKSQLKAAAAIQEISAAVNPDAGPVPRPLDA